MAATDQSERDRLVQMVGDGADLLGRLNGLCTDEGDQVARSLLATIPDYNKAFDKNEDTQGKVSSENVKALMKGLLGFGAVSGATGIELKSVVDMVVDAVKARGDAIYDIDPNNNTDVRSPQECYQSSLERGKKIMKVLNNIGQPSPPLGEAEALKKEFNTTFFKAYLDTRNAKTDGSMAVITKGPAGSKFGNTYNVSDGTITAADNAQKQYGQRDPLNWSDVAFWTFQEELHQARRLDESGRLDSAHLREVQRCLVLNTPTVRTVEHIYATHADRVGGADKVVWTAGDGDAFLALLGTPNCSGAGWLLIDHHDAMHLKKIVSITVEGFVEGFMIERLYITYGN